MRFLTLKRSVVPPIPDPNDGEVRLYADDAGALRTVQQDGTDAPVALGGSVSLDDLSDVDTAGGSEGDVLTQQNDGSYAPEAATGGSQPPLCYEVVLDPTNYPDAGAILPLGLMLEVGDRILDFGISVEAGTTACDWRFGKSPMDGPASQVGAAFLNGNENNDGGPYSTETSNAPHGVYAADAYGGQGRLPCTVLEAHELCVSGADGLAAGSVTISIYILRAATVEALTQPEATPVITSYAPDTGGEGDPVVLAGTGFTGATDVIFVNGVSVASFTVDSDIQITTAVPTGAVTGKVKVQRDLALSAEGPTFTVT